MRKGDKGGPFRDNNFFRYFTVAVIRSWISVERKEKIKRNKTRRREVGRRSGELDQIKGKNYGDKEGGYARLEK